jgi:hypothetical protein
MRAPDRISLMEIPTANDHAGKRIIIRGHKLAHIGMSATMRTCAGSGSRSGHGPEVVHIRSHGPVVPPAITGRARWARSEVRRARRRAGRQSSRRRAGRAPRSSRGTRAPGGPLHNPAHDARIVVRPGLARSAGPVRRSVPAPRAATAVRARRVLAAAVSRGMPGRCAILRNASWRNSPGPYIRRPACRERGDTSPRSS